LTGTPLSSVSRVTAILTVLSSIATLGTPLVVLPLLEANNVTAVLSRQIGVEFALFVVLPIRCESHTLEHPILCLSEALPPPFPAVSVVPIVFYDYLLSLARLHQATGPVLLSRWRVRHRTSVWFPR